MPASHYVQFFDHNVESARSIITINFQKKPGTLNLELLNLGLNKPRPIGYRRLDNIIDS